MLVAAAVLVWRRPVAALYAWVVGLAAHNAVMAALYSAGPSVVENDQLQVPDAFVPDFVTVPTDALSVTVSPLFASDHVPVFVAVAPSLTLTAALLLAIAGGLFGVLTKWAYASPPPAGG